MTKKLLVAWATLAVLCGVAGARDTSASDVYVSQQKVVDQMSAKFGVEVTTRWEPCGEVNAYYSGDDNSITFCTELADYPAFARAVAAHEMAHAVLYNLTGDIGEYAADELAAVWLLRDADDVSAMQGLATYFITNASPKRLGGLHPSDVYRAVWAIKMVDGYLKADKASQTMFDAMVLRYDLRLKFDKVED